MLQKVNIMKLKNGTFLAGILITLLAITLLAGCGRHTGEENDVRPSRVTEGTFDAVYQDLVSVITTPPFYSVEMGEGVITVQFFQIRDDIAQLEVGDLFVLEPTNANPSGISGYITYIEAEYDTITITATLPTTLEEIFYEFNVSNDTDLLAIGAEIVVHDDLAGMPGIEAVRNPNSLFRISFANFEKHGITLNGELILHRPEVNYHIGFNVFNGLDIQLLELVAGATIEISA